MENAITFRFEAIDLMNQLQALGATDRNHLLITFYLEVNPTTKEAVMKAKTESFRQSSPSTPSTSTGDTRGGCPVPPCALRLETQDNGCLQLVDEILKSNNIE
jgi:hypothetical protein